MIAEELRVVQLKNDFYRDGFRKIIFAIGIISIGIVSLIATSIYLYVSKPPPVYFNTDNQWRTVAPIPVTDGNYPTTPDLRQWVSTALQSIFKYSFLNYDASLKSYQGYFTENGWRIFQNFLDKYASKLRIEQNKMFLTGKATAAPTITNYGLIKEQNRYGWWISVPVDLTYIAPGKNEAHQFITFNLLVVRIPTLDNLYGIAIENMVVASAATPIFPGG